MIFHPSTGLKSTTMAVLLVVVAATSFSAQSSDTAPSITSKPVTEVEAGETYLYEVELEGTPEPTLNAQGLPSWLALNDNMLKGTPVRSNAGETGPITLSADNGVAPAADQEFTITVTASPRITSTPVEEVKAGEQYNYTIAVEGSPEPEISSRRLPDWLSLDGNVLKGKPRLADIGRSRNIVLTAENGVGRDARQSFRIVVEENPDYYELPWTVDHAKETIEVGISWTISETSTLGSRGGPNIPDTRDVRKIEVTAVDDDGYTLTFENLRNETSYDFKVSWSQTEMVTIPEEGALRTGDVERREESTTIDGRKVKCVVFQWKDTGPSGAGIDSNTTTELWFCKEFPFWNVRWMMHDATMPMSWTKDVQTMKDVKFPN